MSLRQSGAQKVTDFVNAINGLISSHNSSSTAHSTEMAKKVNVAQGSGNSGKFLKVNSSGNVACESVTIPSAYTHPATHPTSMIYENSNDLDETEVLAYYAEGDTQHDINMAIDQAFIQVSSNIPTTSSSTPSADVSGGAIGSSSNYAKADHQHPLSSAYATSGHNHSGTYAPVSHTQASSTITDMSTVQVVVTYTDSTSETLTLFKQVSS